MGLIIDDFVFFSILGLIVIFLLKLYNVLTVCDVYDRPMSVIILALGIISYLFIEIGLFLNLTIEFNFYLWFSRILVLLIGIFWIVEIILYAAVEIYNQSGRTRMMKKRYG